MKCLPRDRSFICGGVVTKKISATISLGSSVKFAVREPNLHKHSMIANIWSAVVFGW
ncbi:hypothetical protein RCCS2_16421 [Roseobacter sp. CCS2]|nr:hypothetical protein RCCS2_16421 [Roseobacter sp. CCS2]